MNRHFETEDLVKAVSDMIAREDTAAADRFDHEFQKQFRVRGSESQEAIVALNRYWRIELGRLPVNTTSERECLIDQIAPRDWLRHFQSSVLPTILRFELPCVA